MGMDECRHIKVNFKSSEAADRREACIRASELKCRECVPDLVGLLSDGNAGVREAALNALVSIGGSVVAEAVSPLLHSEDAARRNIAGEILQLIGDGAVETLEGLLSDPDDDVVKLAVDILSAHGGGRRTGAALKEIIDHPNSNVRGSVALCLGKVRCEGAYDTLMKMLDDDEEWVRFSAVEGLGHLGDERAVETLVEVIRGEAGIVREAAVEAAASLASAGNASDIIVALEEILQGDGVLSAKAVADLLEKAGCGEGAYTPPPGFSRRAFALFTEALDDPDKDIQREGLRGLALLGEPEGAARVIEYAEGLKEIDEDMEEMLASVLVSIGKLPEVKIDELRRAGRSLKVLVRAMGEMKDKRYESLLDELMGELGKEEKRAVAEAIADMGAGESFDVLVESLRSGDGHVRATAARGLAGSAGEEAVPYLFEALLEEPYTDVREAIADALGSIGSEGVREGFVALLSHDDARLREMGARGLGAAGDCSVVGALVGAAADTDARVTKAAYISLARLASPESFQALAAGLEGGDEGVKLAILRELDAAAAARLSESVRKLLDDQSQWVRYQAAMLLGEMEDRESEDRLIRLLDDDEPPVKVAAAKALQRLGSKRALPALRRLAEYPDMPVSRAAREAIDSIR